MKILLVGILTVILVSFPLITPANDEMADTDILAQRGKGKVSQKDFEARVERIPESARRATLRDRNRVRDVINTLLLRAQLVADARDAGYDQEELVIRRMKLAADAELAEAWVNHYVEIQPPADYEQLAYERYQLKQNNILSTENIDVSHILISTKERLDEEAKALAESLYQQLIVDPSIFDEFVIKYSEDPSASSNNGSFKNVKKGDMLEAFEQTAFALEIGQISSPVKTSYGYHVIRLDGHSLPEKLSFDAVKAQLIEQEKSAHAERIKNAYLSSLTSLDVDMTQEALEEMVRRQFGDDFSDTPTDDDDSG